MTTFGATLRQAREAKGLTCSQVAAQTRLLVQIVEEMENEDFHRIAAPIYGRGFVRLYAECVGLDPQPLIREFMDIYEGRRGATVRVRQVPGAEPAPAAPSAPAALEPVAMPPVAANPFAAAPAKPAAPVAPAAPAAAKPIPDVAPDLRGLDLFDPPSAPVAPAPAPRPNPFAAESPYLSSKNDEEEASASERFRASLTEISRGVIHTMNGIPRRTWRIAALCAAAALALALIAWGCVKLYSITAAPAGAEQNAAAAAPTAPAAAKPKTPPPPRPAATGKLRSTGHAIPALYAD